MAIICPTITAHNEEAYHQQMERVSQLGHRLQIDLTDGRFARALTVRPEQAWWPVGVMADFHLMYKEPLRAVETILEHRAHMIIVHAEADGDFEKVARYCRHLGVKVGLALLPQTSAQVIFPALSLVDHVLIFSGNLGHQGGSYADLSLLNKIGELRGQKPSLEIGWDGGINSGNVRRLADAGVDVLNVGGFLQDAANPRTTYKELESLANAHQIGQAAA